MTTIKPDVSYVENKQEEGGNDGVFSEGKADGNALPAEDEGTKVSTERSCTAALRDPRGGCSDEDDPRTEETGETRRRNPQARGSCLEAWGKQVIF